MNEPSGAGVKVVDRDLSNAGSKPSSLEEQNLHAKIWVKKSLEQTFSWAATYSVFASEFFVETVSERVDKAQQWRRQNLTEIQDENIVIADPIVDTINCWKNVQNHKDDWVRWNDTKVAPVRTKKCTRGGGTGGLTDRLVYL